MSAQEGNGYIYRVAKASAAEVQDIVATQVKQGSTFGGAAQWDLHTKKLRENLRPIDSFAVAARVNVCGDFGHAFNKHIEVRWKRRDDGDYDVLILSETEPSVDGAVPLDIGKNQQWRTRMYAKAAILQTDARLAIAYIDYLAPNGAVQFQRLVEVK